MLVRPVLHICSVWKRGAFAEYSAKKRLAHWIFSHPERVRAVLDPERGSGAGATPPSLLPIPASHHEPNRECLLGPKGGWYHPPFEWPGD